MRITSIAVHEVDLPLKEGAYSWSTQSFTVFDSTVLIITTDSGLTGRRVVDAQRRARGVDPEA